MEERYEILIIDDNIGFAENLKDILMEHHYSVSLAPNGTKAVEMVHQREFDLVLIDINLPDIFGLDLVEKMSALAPRQEYIIITGHGTLETAVEAVKQKKIVSFEMKPLDIHHLLSLIHQIKERKLAAEALRISEERFRIFSESATDAFLTINEAGIIISLNPEFENIFGYSIEEVLGKPLTHLIPSHFDYLQLFGKKKKGIPADRRSDLKRVEVNGLHKSGAEIPLEISFGRYQTKEGNFYTSIIRNITERKRKEQALKASEGKFRTIVENGQPVIYLLDTEGKFLLSEGKSLASLGLKPGEVVGKSALELYKDFPDIIKGINDALNGSVNNSVVEINNLVFDSFYSPLRDENGLVTGVLGMSLDITDRMQAELALKESEKRYRLLVNSAPQPIFTVSKEGVYQFMNAHAALMFGGVPADFTGTTIWDHFQKEHADQHMQDIRNSLETGPFSSIICLSFLKGKEYWFSSHLQPIRLEDSSVEGCLVILYDITERKITEVKTQQRLEAEKIASLVSERFVGITDFEQAVDDTLRDIGLYCEASRTFLLLKSNILKNTKVTFDWLSEELPEKARKKKKPILQYERFIKEYACGQDLIITDVEKIPKNEEAIKTSLLAMGINSLFLLPLFAKRSLIGYWGMDNFGNPGDWTVEKFNLLVVISNIFSSAFHRRCVEQELSASEEIHRILLNASQEGIAIMDKKGKIIEVSDITLKLLGYENKEEILGRNYIELVPKPLHQIVKDIFEKTLENGITQNVELEFIKTDNTLFSAEVSTTLITEIDGAPRGFMSAIRDVTYRKTVEKQLIHTERMAGIGEMAAGIAHEINQPLNTISLTLDNLLFSFKNGEMDKEYLETKSFKLFQNIARMRNIIDHVRTFSRQNDDYILGNFNVNDSIRNAISMVSEQFKHKGINLILNLDEKIRLPIGNTYKFEQVVLNLIINAKDAIEEKKKHLDKEFNKCIEICSYEDPTYIYVEVKDNGTGIEPEKIDKVFLPFYTSKETGSGTGLGLSISFGIIKDMQGTIEVESKFKKGTTIKITIPADAKRKGNHLTDDSSLSKKNKS